MFAPVVASPAGQIALAIAMLALAVDIVLGVLDHALRIYREQRDWAVARDTRHPSR